MDAQMIHHSALSFKQLRSVKLKDHFSVSFVSLDKKQVSTETLTLWFGQFGEICSIRVLKDKQEMYIRFASQAAALSALRWCLSQPLRFREVKHGYTRYCKSFISGKQCGKADCTHRHSWADTKDILNFSKEFVPNGATEPQPACLPRTDLVCPHQSAFSDHLVVTITALQQENAALKAQIVRMAAVLQARDTYSHVHVHTHANVDTIGDAIGGETSLSQIVDGVIENGYHQTDWKYE